MRSDYHQAVKALRGAEAALQNVELAAETDQIEPGGAFVSVVRRATGALFDTPLAAAVIDQEEQRRMRPSPVAGDACDSFIATITSDIATTYDRALNIRAEWERIPTRDQNAWSKLWASAEWRGGALDLGAILEGLGRKTWSGGFGLDDLKVVRRALLALTHTIDITEVADVAKRVDYGTPIQKRIEPLIGQLDKAIAVVDVAAQSWHADGAENLRYLRHLHRRLHDLSVDGLKFPLPPDDPFPELLKPATCSAVRDLLLDTIRFVVDELDAGPLKGYAIARLRAYLERFARDKLIADIAGAPAKGKKSRKPEARVQDEVDRFLFVEGFFPITHAVAGQGRIDTFIEQNRHVFEDPGLETQAPILLELKQAIGAGAKKKTTKNAVADAVKDALAQAEEYRRHLRANFKWLDNQVFAVVVYDGPVRYSSADPSVVLVYLGTANPSEGVGAL